MSPPSGTTKGCTPARKLSLKDGVGEEKVERSLESSLFHSRSPGTRRSRVGGRRKCREVRTGQSNSREFRELGPENG